MNAKKSRTNKVMPALKRNRVSCFTNANLNHEEPSRSLPNHLLSDTSSHNVLNYIGQEENQTYYSIQALRRKHLIEGFIKKIRHLIPPTSVPDGVMQDWQQGQKNGGAEQEAKNPELYNLNNVETEMGFKFSWWKILQTIQGLFLIGLFWMASVELFFLKKAYESEGITSLFPFSLRCVIACALILKVLIKEVFVVNLSIKIEHEWNSNANDYLNPSPIQSQDDDSYKINLKQDITKPLFNLFVYLLYLLIDVIFTPTDTARYVLLTFVSIALFFMLQKLKFSFEPIITYIESKNLKNEFRLFKLLFLSIALCHLIALIMFSMTFIYTDRNWLLTLEEGINEPSENVEKNKWIKQYTFAMYWAITTIVTVGYGDITPTRFYEFVVISIVQLIGTAMFGYMINVIGITVAQINKKNEKFENHVSTINKLANQYQISRRLCQKFKNQIIHHEEITKQTPLNSEQETEFLKLISPQARDSFTLQTNIKVIKKSIFFLTHFTVNFQNQIALKLIRIIYRKGQTIKISEKKQKQRLHQRAYDAEYEGKSEKVLPSFINEKSKYQNRNEMEEKQRFIAIVNSGSAKIELQIKNNNMEICKFLKTIKIEEGKPNLNVFGYSSLIMNRDIDLVATAQQNTVVYLLKRKDILECLDKNMLDFQSFTQQRQKMLQFRNLNQVQAPTIKDITLHYVPNLYVITKKNRRFLQQRNKQFLRKNIRTKLKLITLANYKDRTLMYIQDESEEQHDKKMIDVSANFINYPEQQLSAETKVTKKPFLAMMDVAKNYENFMKRSNISNVVQKYHNYLQACIEIRQKNQRMLKFAQLKRQIQKSQDNIIEESDLASECEVLQ